MKHSLFIVGTAVASLSLAAAANARCFETDLDCIHRQQFIRSTDLYLLEQRIEQLEHEVWINQTTSWSDF